MARGTLHIGDVAGLLGITPKAIRHYHRLGLLDEPTRQANGYRLYEVEHLHRLRLILRLQAMGLSLRQIAFIFEADDADALLHDLLRARAAAIQDDIARLQAQSAEITAFLDADQPIAAWERGAAPVSALQIVQEAVRPVSGGLADIVAAVEAETLAALDRYAWSEGYAAYWQAVGERMAAELRPHEHAFILWLERYLTVAGLDPDDRQAQAWLDDLARSPVRHVLVATVALPEVEGLPLAEQVRVRRLLPLLLQADASPLQREFIRVLSGGLR